MEEEINAPEIQEQTPLDVSTFSEHTTARQIRNIHPTVYDQEEFVPQHWHVVDE